MKTNSNVYGKSHKEFYFLVSLDHNDCGLELSGFRKTKLLFEFLKLEIEHMYNNF